MGTPTQVPGRRWCAQHHHFHRNCADCVETDFDSLVERINEGWYEVDALRTQLEQTQAEREEAIMRGVRGIHYLCGTSEALREIVATLLAESERLRKLLELIRYLAAERLDDGHGYTMMLTTIIIDIDAALRGEEK